MKRDHDDLPAVNPEGLRTYSLSDRPSKVGIADLGAVPDAAASVGSFIDGLPNVLAAADLKDIATAIAAAHKNGNRVLLGMGAHPIKVGLSPTIIRLIETGVVTGLLVNGACLIHDFELAYAGKTSEDVGAVLGDGGFGMAKETGDEINRMIAEGVADGRGLAESVGAGIEQIAPAHAELSILAAAHRKGIPLSCAVAIGTDIVHMHPACDGAAIGEGALRDFRLLARTVADLKGGVYVNLGSAVLLPEVFLKAVSMAHNAGHSLDGLVTVVMDFIRHYRATVNVQQRPTAGVGKGYYLVGHHEIMFPLLAAAVMARLPGGGT